MDRNSLISQLELFANVEISTTGNPEQVYVIVKMAHDVKQGTAPLADLDPLFDALAQFIPTKPSIDPSSNGRALGFIMQTGPAKFARLNIYDWQRDGRAYMPSPLKEELREYQAHGEMRIGIAEELADFMLHHLYTQPAPEIVPVVAAPAPELAPAATPEPAAAARAPARTTRRS